LIKYRLTKCYQAALLSSVIAGAFSWPAVANTHWLVKGFWYCSLALSLASIATATEQAVALSRIVCHPKGLVNLRDVLGKPSGAIQVPYEPRRLQLYVWHIPLAMLNASIYLFLLGLLAYLLDSLLRPRQDGDLNDVKVWSKLVLCTIAMLTLR
jgi:hypothetical protein